MRTPSTGIWIGVSGADEEIFAKQYLRMIV